ncbi:MAG: 50S ribosomal protein L32 [Parcubacteria group bacterium 21-58-10]|nr:MAG: 50S ribosomal protein L32 [Parcubacteria group bacterium 21-58-10]
MSIRMRHTSGHTGNRRSHHALKNTNIVKDAESGNLRLPHRLDEATGMYRGKQIAPARGTRAAKEKKVKGASTEPAAKHVHEHAHEEHANAEVKASKGIAGKVATGGRPKARSGFGGGV